MAGAFSLGRDVDSAEPVRLGGDQRGAVMVRISAVVTLTTLGRIGWDKDVLKLPRLSPGRAPVRPGLFICGARSISPIPFDWMSYVRGPFPEQEVDQRGPVSMLSLYSALLTRG